ncbi:MAG: chemoreceptor glutamine deamidase CheD [Pseudomonadota bacterium]|nr:chemotaxis protein CheD [Alteromonadaceae bacterium]MCP4865529.1 chemoreceptor glutamine deamidase CheD [Alteromonas sp.]MDY6925515.1 chemoreceptor glutamine deamidase CheD [Pseudomonadota bacterium]RPH18544.1 MAG: chemoreceptor glutamine deamidase CheD [Alteromonadaceae bacterium TMED7]|tara:strand:- start:13367 stop:13960 length:594 start_codon:yes stop_codon:yes gene_type:complete
MASNAERFTKTPTPYFDPYFQRAAVKLLPGQYYVTSGETMIVTTLGSCVAACVRDKVSGIGGMNHFMLPAVLRPDQQTAKTFTKYGVFAMQKLLETLTRMGAKPANFEAKVFGGGHVMEGFASCDVGTQNARFIEQFMATNEIPIVSRDLYQDYARKVYFLPQTGEVQMRRIRRLNNTTIIEREKAHRISLSRRVVG